MPNNLNNQEEDLNQFKQLFINKLKKDKTETEKSLKDIFDSLNKGIPNLFESIKRINKSLKLNLNAYDKKYNELTTKYSSLENKFEDLKEELIKKVEDTTTKQYNLIRSDYDLLKKNVDAYQTQFKGYESKIKNLEKKIEDGITASADPKAIAKQVKEKFRELVKSGDYVTNNQLNKTLEDYVSDKEIEEIQTMINTVKILDDRLDTMDKKMNIYEAKMTHQYKKAEKMYIKVIAKLEELKSTNPALNSSPAVVTAET